MSDAKGLTSGRLLLLILSALIAIGPFTMEAYLPALPTIAKELDVNIVQVNVSISTFLIGMALGQLVGGPISDIVGRKKNATYGLAIFCVASVGIVLSDNIQLIQLLRAIQGIGSGFSAVVAMPTIRDMFEPEVAAKKIPIVSSVMLIAPLTAPIVGTLLMQWGWRYIFMFVVVISILVLITYRSYVPETRQKTEPASFRKVIKQYKQVIMHQVDGQWIGVKYLFLTAFSSGVFLVFLTNAAWIYLEHYQVSKLQFPLLFAVSSLSFLFANLLLTRLLRWFDAFRILRTTSILQSLALLLMFFLSQTEHLPLAGFVVVIALLIGSTALTNNCAVAMLFAYFSRLTGSVTSLLAFVRFTLGAGLGIISGLLFDHTLTPIVGTMLLSSLISMSVTRMLPKTTLREVSKTSGAVGI